MIKKIMGHKVVIEREDDYYWGKFLDFPGCMAHGNTIDECIEELENALYLRFRVLADVYGDAPVENVIHLSQKDFDFVKNYKAEPTELLIDLMRNHSSNSKNL